MKKFTISVAIILLASTVFAAGQKHSGHNGNGMQGDMIKNCQQHIKDGEVVDSMMPKDMMSQCQKMMKDGGMMQEDMQGGGNAEDSKTNQVPARVSEEEHKRHHPKK